MTLFKARPQLVALLGTTLMASAGLVRAEADLSSTITLTSDYDFRGITQTAQDPALQGSLDLAFDNGVYGGLWASNVDFGAGQDSDVEVDILIGYGGAITEALAYDLGLVYYAYLPDDDDIDYFEVYGGLSAGIFATKLWYAPDYVDSGDSAYYLEGNLEGGGLPLDLGWVVHLGYSGGDYWDDTESNGLDTYYDWAVGLTRTVSRFDFALKWADGSNLSEADGTPSDANSSEGRVILSVATTFPWSDE